LTIAVNSDNSERKQRRSGSIASISSVGADVLPVPSLRGNELEPNAMQVEDETHEDDDVALVVSEKQPQLLAALGGMDSNEKEQLDSEARKIQSNVRAWILRRQYQQIREAATKVQALAKGHLARRHFRELREKASATLVIQKSMRAHIKAKHFAKQQKRQQTDGTLNSFTEIPTGSESHKAQGSVTLHAPVHLAGLETPISAVGMSFFQNPVDCDRKVQFGSSTNSGVLLNDRRFSTAVENPSVHPSHADDFLLSSEDIFDVNMREDSEV